ncbi:MAG: anti-sigma factor [Gomphosphaeria aponina SAG 52.96 = DSM 107014]|uniref:Anti-sigma factor n=1 Tax=Gomphosphaeria aponina SAG 52.96 = DSM 107014 TaxID=1521640 RepID=A0A941JV45_9CHRO|nr:anti-sigma factor [Gomphosphaeria aponina SAG 52.96 = DSM 107014]
MYDNNNNNQTEEERFELLSAYLDGEVSATERHLVEQWLETDPQFRKLYQNLLRIQQGMQNIPVPPPAKSAQQLSAGVFQEIDRRKRFSRIFVWGGGAIAATLVAAMSSLLGNNSPAPQLAISPPQQFQETGLLIAINRPPIEIENPQELMLPLNRPPVEINY